jgi:hypothetical protein
VVARPEVDTIQQRFGNDSLLKIAPLGEAENLLQI